MCGISGILAPSHSADFLEARVVSMISTLSHRGPDGQGVWIDPMGSLALAHRRLSIIDLSQAGHQPMVSRSGRYVMAFNGEIYNHMDLRHSLETIPIRHAWRGLSDSESLLEAVETWGLEDTLRRCVGMFSIAIWDTHQKVLSLARDRFGEKPLYWGFTGQQSQRCLLFASELSSLNSFPGFNNSIDRASLIQYFRFGCISAPRSIYTDVQQLEPGHLVQIPLYGTSFEILPTSRPWWSFNSSACSSLSNPLTHPDEALHNLRDLLLNVVQLQSRSDVPLGSFLSGGIDSSLITALMQQVSSTPVRTFTVGFENSDFNEAPFARSVSNYLGTDHTEILLTSRDALQLIPSLPKLYSEPFADSSQLPTHLVCREARRSGLRVVLSGDGGDELFGGYNRYFWGPRIWKNIAWLPIPLRQALAHSITFLPPSLLDLLGHLLTINQFGHKSHKLAERLLSVRGGDDLYRSLVSIWNDPSNLLESYYKSPQFLEPISPIDLPLPSPLSSNKQLSMLAYDTLNYLPNDILTKVDRASMAASLEVRSPFLDHRVAELAWRLPNELRLGRDNEQFPGKTILRQLLYQYVPRHLVERPKSGFGVPIGHWLRGPLKPWADSLLDPSLIYSQGFLRPEPVQLLWKQHLSGRFDHTSRLWTILMWQSWLLEWS